VRAGRCLIGVASLWLGLALGQVGVAAAAPTLDQPQSPSNNASPSFSGTVSDPIPEWEAFAFHPVRVNIYETAGGEAVGNPIQPPLETTQPFFVSTWSVGPAEALPPGIYVAQAEQLEAGSPEAGKSAPVKFKIDTTPPAVLITSPASGSAAIGNSQVVGGTAGTAEGDEPAVILQVYAGTVVSSEAFLEALELHPPGASFSTTLGGLGPGTYTVRAMQRDDAGNVGFSAPVSFSLTSPPPPPSPQPPRASFSWLPPAPRVGETVSLLSSSTDASSPITAFAWALVGNGPFRAGKPLITTSFSAPGGHLVRLRVTAANGLSSVAAETIPVAPAALTLMQPFPIVRIAGAETSTGVRLSVLSVQAPVGARITVSCQGRSCPIRSQSRVAASRVRRGRSGTVRIAFRRFERSLRAGVILRIRVSKAGEVGKYTRFVIRRRVLPERLDTCLDPGGFKPMACPSS